MFTYGFIGIGNTVRTPHQQWLPDGTQSQAPVGDLHRLASCAPGKQVLSAYKCAMCIFFKFLIKSLINLYYLFFLLLFFFFNYY